MYVLCSPAAGARLVINVGAPLLRVTDSTGAVIPGASVHAVNQATGVAANTKSNGVGFYQVPSLFTGTYTVTFTAAGMKTSIQTLELLVDQNAVINVTLAAGAVTQQVEVNASAIQLTTTDSGTVAATLENALINQLPLDQRFPLAHELLRSIPVPHVE